MVDVDLIVLARCVNILQEIFGEASIICQWWEWPHPRLGNKKPRVAMVDGNINRVLKVLQDMQTEKPS